MSRILFRGGGCVVVSQHALQVVSQDALQQVSGEGVYRPTPKGGLRGSGLGPHPRGKLRGIWSRPTPKGKVKGDLASCGGLLRGCLLWGEGACCRGYGDPPPCDSYCCRYASYWNAFLLQWMHSSRMHTAHSSSCHSMGGGVSTPKMATAAGGLHPTGMHSCNKSNLRGVSTHHHPNQAPPWDQTPPFPRTRPFWDQTPQDQVPPGTRTLPQEQAPPLWTETLTHATENITLSQTSFADGNKLVRKVPENHVCTILEKFVKCGIRTTLCWKIWNIFGSAKLLGYNFEQWS